MQRHLTNPQIHLTFALGLATIVSLSALVDVTNAQDPATQQPRKLAPGVLRKVVNMPEPRETASGPLALGELVNITDASYVPNYAPKSQTINDMAKRVTLRREVWTIDFEFKPLRMVPIDIPQPSGVMKRKLIWYMVYRITNSGNHLRPVASKDDFDHDIYGVEKFSRNVRFLPHFVLEGLVQKGGLTPEFTRNKREQYEQVSYLDRIIPAAIDDIYERENPGKGIPLYNSVEISRISLAPNQSAWGVVTWENVDPRIDFLSIYTKGLSNAFDFGAPGGQAGYRHKTLQLNFYRPGDWIAEHEDEITFGIPTGRTERENEQFLQLYGVPDRLDHRWIFR